MLMTIILDNPKTISWCLRGVMSYFGKADGHYFTLLMEDGGICPLFPSPPRGDLTTQQSQPSGICHPRQKMVMPGGKLRGGGWKGLGTAGIDRCIILGNHFPPLVARKQPPLPSNKTREMFFRGGRRLYTAWLF